MEKLDIVNLIEQNPLIKLSKNYQSKFLEKIQENFTESQQKIFISSFYCYLNYNQKVDFVIELESIWKWLGFSRKEHCKVVLEKHFKVDIDYKIVKGKFDKILVEEIILPKLRENKSTAETRGRKSEKVLMTIHTFNKLCLKSNTKKADEIHDYFIKLEELTQETLNEESEELRSQLQQKDIQLIGDKQNILLKSYNKKCIVYLIKINDNEPNGMSLFKFGNTDDIKRRFTEHRREITEDAELVYCIESKNNVKLENDFKEYLKLTNYRKEQIINNKNQTELIVINACNISIIQNELEKLNKNIIEDKDFLAIKKLELELLKEKNVNKVENDEIDEYNSEISRRTRYYDLEIKKLEIEEMKEKTKQMSIELEFKKLPKLELQHPQPKEELNYEKLQEENVKLTNENKQLTKEVTELRAHKAHRLIRNRGTKEEATKNKESLRTG